MVKKLKYWNIIKILKIQRKEFVESWSEGHLLSMSPNPETIKKSINSFTLKIKSLYGKETLSKPKHEQQTVPGYKQHICNFKIKR